MAASVNGCWSFCNPAMNCRLIQRLDGRDEQVKKKKTWSSISLLTFDLVFTQEVTQRHNGDQYLANVVA